MNKKRLFQTIRLATKRSARKRADYLRKKQIFGFIGENVGFQPRMIPLYPELIRIHNNVMIAAGVRLVTHDASFTVLNRLGKGSFPEQIGCIEIMDNVFIGYNATILPNVRIGSNVIVGACSVVTKDLEPDGIYVGSPAKRIGSFSDFLKKRGALSDGSYSYPYVKKNQNMTQEEAAAAWAFFESNRAETREEETQSTVSGVND